MLAWNRSHLLPSMSSSLHHSVILPFSAMQRLQMRKLWWINFETNFLMPYFSFRYYGVVSLLPIFQYSNVYAATPKLRLLAENKDLQQRCIKYVSKSGIFLLSNVCGELLYEALITLHYHTRYEAIGSCLLESVWINWLGTYWPWMGNSAGW